MRRKLNICVFFHAFEPCHECKDPGQILLGLRDIGLESEMVTLQKSALDGYTGLPIRTITPEQAKDINFWRSTTYDAVIAYSWLRSDYFWIPEILKKAGKKVIIKSDTDGRMAFPLHPRWDCFTSSTLGIIPILKILRRKMKRRVNAPNDSEDLISHLKIADITVVETPQSFSNLAYILGYWKRTELLRKIEIIPNPVATDVLSTNYNHKKNQLVAIGNWNVKFGDYLVKNTKVMCNVLTKFLSLNPNYQAFIIGEGQDLLNKLLAKSEPCILNRIKIIGRIPHEDVIKYLSHAKIIFAPSISESFGLAVSEGICMGCSIVGSPLESFQFLSNGGFCGTLASTFEEQAYLGALIADTIRWEKGAYSPKRIATYWRAELDRKTIAGKYARMLEHLLGSSTSLLAAKGISPAMYMKSHSS